MTASVAPATTDDVRPPAATAARGALVMGGAHGSLAVARSLGRRDIPVWFLTHDHPLARFSRYVTHSGSWPGPNDPDAAEFLLRFGRRHRLDGWTLFPCGDAEVQFVARNHAALSAAFRVATPPWAITRWTADKRLTHQFAAEIGLHSPWSYYPRDRQDVAQVDCRFPVILKPTVHEQRNSFTRAKAWRADDRETLVARFVEAAALVGEQQIVLQELIPGGGERQFSYAALCDRGVPVASLVARRTRQFPIDFGYTSTFVETIERPELEEAACRLLRSLEYSGLVEVEFKYDVRDGRYKLLDINARPWTWLGLGAAAGVDFPFLAWQLAQGETPVPARGRADVRWIHLTRDVAAVCQQICAGVRSPTRYRNTFWRPVTFAVFATDDPLPGLLELPLVVARMLMRSMPRRRTAGRAPTAQPRPTP
ncbi:MAG: ATP-grasp domain-containing protein [Rhizobiales bacterium]|nr:ATP-grasp domain-containing protein [Hyphomicrobiales bacterium]